MKLCNCCGDLKRLAEFHTRTVNGKQYPETWCGKCCNKRRRRQERRTKTTLRAIYMRNAEYHKRARANFIKRAPYVLKDLRKFDKLRGLENDLDLEFVKVQLVRGCTYCGAPQKKIRMSLDRIDNSLGHTKINVNPSCSNCNLTRGNMPYKAWLMLVPAMRHAREVGLLANWCRRR